MEEPVGDPGEKDALKHTAMDLLNRRGNEFRASEALEKIPANWSLAAIYPAIEKMTQKSLHTVSEKILKKSQMMLRQFLISDLLFTEKNSAHTEISFSECQFRHQIRAHSALKGTNHSKWKQASPPQLSSPLLLHKQESDKSFFAFQLLRDLQKDIPRLPVCTIPQWGYCAYPVHERPQGMPPDWSTLYCWFVRSWRPRRKPPFFFPIRPCDTPKIRKTICQTDEKNTQHSLLEAKKIVERKADFAWPL